MNRHHWHIEKVGHYQLTRRRLIDTFRMAWWLLPLGGLVVLIGYGMFGG